MLNKSPGSGRRIIHNYSAYQATIIQAQQRERAKREAEKNTNEKIKQLEQKLAEKDQEIADLSNKVDSFYESLEAWSNK